MATPESKVRDPVVAWAKQNGFLHQRMAFRVGVSNAFPDDVFIAPGGIHVWIEFKRLGKEPTPLQYNRLERLEKQGVAAFWADNKEDAIRALKRIVALAAAFYAANALEELLPEPTPEQLADEEFMQGSQWTPEQIAQMKAKLN